MANPSCVRWNYFNPHSPCGERPDGLGVVDIRIRISIHTPLAGSDVHRSHFLPLMVGFQSTLPLRGATKQTLIPLSGTVFQSTLPLRGATSYRTASLWS